jgi:hypothetical protein
MNAFTLRGMLVTVLLGLISTEVRAQQTYVVPPGNANIGGTGGTFSLLTVDYTGQQVYSANLLAGLPNGAVINGFRMRLAPGQSTVTSAVSSPNFDISIGPSVFPPGSLSTVTASNQGPGTVLARSGPITFPANSFIGGSNPNPWGPLISFTTPYTHTSGTDLLLTFSDRAFTSLVTLDAQAGLFGDAQGRQNVGTYNSSTVPQNVNGFAIIVQLNYSVVPEPTTVALVGLGVVTAAGLWWRRRRQLRLAAANELNPAEAAE